MIVMLGDRGTLDGDYHSCFLEREVRPFSLNAWGQFSTDDDLDTEAGCCCLATGRSRLLLDADAGLLADGWSSAAGDDLV